MGELLAIDPELRFPTLRIFEIGDGFNKERGKYYYCDARRHMHGPFFTHLEASLDMVKNTPGGNVPMRTPFESDAMWWWKQDSVSGVQFAGPYENAGQAYLAITKHIQDLKDKANVYR